MTRGRPLRFLVVTLSGWTVLRVTMLWPAPAAPEISAAIVVQPLTALQAATDQPRTSAAMHIVLPVSPTIEPSSMVGRQTALLLANGRPAALGTNEVAPASFAVQATPPTEARAPSEVLLIPPATLVSTVSQSYSRLTGSSWLMIRRGTGDSLADGQLGASQAGVRLTYAIDRARRIALSGRLSTPLQGQGQEAAFGLDWQPTRLPVHLLIERRVDTDTGQSRTAGQVIAGAAFVMPLGFTLDSYAQAGGVARRGGFVDGAARLARSIETVGPARLEAGIGIWGGAQRGTTRLDVGPTIAIAFPARHGLARLSLEYRVRAAGRARPGSGPALTLGSSF